MDSSFKTLDKKPVNSVEELNELIQKYFVKNTKTNNYLLSDAYLQYINDKRLFYAATESNLCFLVENPFFFKQYYYLNDFKEPICLNADKPLVMEIIYRGEKNKPVDILNYWKMCNFDEHLTRDNMMASFKQLKLPEKGVSGVELRYASTEEEIIFTKELIENTLDKYTGDILSYEEVKEFVENKNVICAYWEGELAGILQFEIKNNIVWLDHISVDAKFRGKGIANELVRAYIADNAVGEKTRYQLWVIQDNFKATALYRKFGFVYGNKSTVSMLKKL